MLYDLRNVGFSPTFLRKGRLAITPVPTSDAELSAVCCTAAEGCIAICSIW